jgi:hypothetical protein
MRESICPGKDFMKRFATLLTGLALMGAPSAALAQGSSTCQAYNPQLCEATSTETSASSLPFTGLDVGLLVVGGGSLFGAGIVVRRLSRRLN